LIQALLTSPPAPNEPEQNNHRKPQLPACALFFLSLTRALFSLITTRG
jgi:hypothetical protein